jgi:hypothetical protein
MFFVYIVIGPRGNSYVDKMIKKHNFYRQYFESIHYFYIYIVCAE